MINILLPYGNHHHYYCFADVRQESGLDVADLALEGTGLAGHDRELQHSASGDADQRRCQMNDRTDVWRRLDLYHISTGFAAATAGGCGFTQLGRVCQLPHRHRTPVRCRITAAQPIR
jgi:hypothetical protein